MVLNDFGNLAHRWLCRSGYWRKAVETYTLPWVLEDLDIGKNVLEIGPGPGVLRIFFAGVRSASPALKSIVRSPIPYRAV
jgi:hypothetical protein